MSDTVPGYIKQPHLWGPPPPGQGRGEVCSKCGTKRVHGEGGECSPYFSDSVTSSEYEPIP